MTDARWDEAGKLFDVEPQTAVRLAEQIEREDTPTEKPHDERRAHQCRHDGCDSAAVYEVYLHVRYGLRHKAIETLKSSLRVCESHKRAANDFLLSPHNRKIISAQLATIGRLSIDWGNAMVEFVPVGEIAWGPQNMVALHAGTA